MWSKSFEQRLLRGEWHLIKTTRDQPFVTSDHPVFGEHVPERQLSLVSFPISAERAIIVTSGGQFNVGLSSEEQVAALNHQTIARAVEFIVVCK
jgi:hypothetical protein